MFPPSDVFVIIPTHMAERRSFRREMLLTRFCLFRSKESPNDSNASLHVCCSCNERFGYRDSGGGGVSIWIIRHEKKEKKKKLKNLFVSFVSMAIVTPSPVIFYPKKKITRYKCFELEDAPPRVLPWGSTGKIFTNNLSVNIYNIGKVREMGHSETLLSGFTVVLFIILYILKK